MSTPVEIAFVVFGIVFGLVTRAMGVGKPPTVDDEADRGLRVNSRSTEEIIRVIYGQIRVGGNDVYIGSSGNLNTILWMVQTLGEGELDSIATDDDGNDKAYLDDDQYTSYGSAVSYYFHSGAATQTTDSNLTAALAEWTDNLKNTAYIVWKLTYNQDLFQGSPRRTVEIKGRKLYDFRNDVTAYSNNPVLCLYDYMTNTRYGLGHLITSSEIDTASWTSSANYCDTRGWGFNYAITKDQSAQNIIDIILSHFRGTLVWYDGKYYLRYADINDESSVMTLTDSHIVQDSNGRAQLQLSQPSRFKRPTGARISYLDPDRDYIVDHVLIGSESGVVEEIPFTGASSRQMASDLGVYTLERRQLDKTITGLFRDDALQLEPHDLITFSSDSLSISNQLMRVMDAKIQPSGLINLGLQYEATALYDDDYNLDANTIYSCSLPDPKDTPPEVSNPSFTEETYYYRLRTFTRLKVAYSFTPSYPWLKHVEVWQSFDNSTWNHLFNVATNDFVIDPVSEGDRHYFKLITVSVWGTKNDGYIRDITIAGDTDPPDSLDYLNASVNENSVNLWGNKLTDPDIELYEFRLGSAWTGSVHLASLRSPNMSLKGVKPGSHTFWANTLGNNGLYGEIPRSATVSIKDPPDGWTIKAGETKTEDYL